MAKAISDVYQSMLPKHVNTHVRTLQEEAQQQQQSQFSTVNESSIISAYAKKKTSTNANVNSKLIAALTHIKESITVDPVQAQRHLEAIIKTL
jgi:hypothetical protein